MREVALNKAAKRTLCIILACFTIIIFFLGAPQSLLAGEFISFYPEAEERTQSPPNINTLSILCRQKQFLGDHITFAGDDNKKVMLVIFTNNRVEDLSEVVSLVPLLVQFSEDTLPVPSVLFSYEATMDWAYIYDRNIDGEIDYVAYFYAALSLKPDDFPQNFPKIDAVPKDDVVTSIEANEEQYQLLKKEARLFFQHHADDNFDGTSDSMVAAILDPDRYPWVGQFGVLRSNQFDGKVDETWTFKKDITQKTGIVEEADNKFIIQNAPNSPLLTGKESLNEGTVILKRINKFAKKCSFSNDSFLQNSKVSLIEASSSENIKKVKELLKAGVNVNTPDNIGTSALMSASNTGNSEIVNILLDAGANINYRNNDGYNALIASTIFEGLEVVNLLISKGADVNAKEKDGYTPLMFAALLGYYDIVKFLLNNGADVNAKAKDGATALMLAKQKGFKEVTLILKEAGAKE